MYRIFIKRFIDIVFSGVALAALSPLLILTALLLFVVDGGSPLFMQERPGKGGRVFRVVKFKTMNNRRDQTGKLLPDSERITILGKFVRSTSLDELPQLVNVLVGDMSLVGPRPLLVKYLSLYNERQARRHEVRPGITGWAQVNGRNAISWQERFELDVYYVDNLSFWLDLKILFLTVRKVLKREGISSQNSVTMDAFKGN